MSDNNNCLDVLENDILAISEKLMSLLLKDHTTQENIFWATDDYAPLGRGYSFYDPIRTELITGDNGNVIMPRVAKSKLLQASRSKDMAEVFTPSWLCNKQNNLIDEAWFGRADVFNKEIDSGNCHTWESTKERIIFPDNLTWKDYVNATRLEITCGEAPYLCSRYDATTGNIIPIEERIGLLDRKLRVVSENTDNSGDWLKYAQKAYENIYGYEWQGDNLLIARENLLFTFLDYYEAKFHKKPLLKSFEYIGYIISWNIIQMDGLKFGLPGYEPKEHIEQTTDLFGNEHFEQVNPHNRYCLVRDWKQRTDGKQKIQFASLIKP